MIPVLCRLWNLPPLGAASGGASFGIGKLSAELAGIDAVGAQLPGDGALGELPLRVVVAGGAANDTEQRAVDNMTGLRRQLAKSPALPSRSC